MTGDTGQVMLQIRKLRKNYGDVQALRPLDAVFAKNSFTCIVGRSGCGKTTLLRLLAGLEEPSGGSVCRAEGCRTAIVFQEPRLMPWLTVAENITFASKNGFTGLDRHRLEELLAVLELSGKGHLYPCQLSGGMAQRVSLGRTLYYDPDVLLMDEPFSALDYFTRQGLQNTLLKLFSRQRKTIVFVTHDVEEALLLGDRVLIMDKGAVKSAVNVALPRPRQAAQHEFQLLRQKILRMLS